MKGNPVGSGRAVGTSKWAHCEHGGLDLGSGFRGTLCWLQQNRILEQAHSRISLENYKIVRNRKKKPLQLRPSLLAVGVSTLTRAPWVTHFLPSVWAGKLLVGKGGGLAGSKASQGWGSGCVKMGWQREFLGICFQNEGWGWAVTQLAPCTHRLHICSPKGLWIESNQEKKYLHTKHAVFLSLSFIKQ